jgi:hypothetical protein
MDSGLAADAAIRNSAPSLSVLPSISPDHQPRTLVMAAKSKDDAISLRRNYFAAGLLRFSSARRACRIGSV